MTPQRLRRTVLKLEAAQPETARFEAAIAVSGPRKRDAWYDAQKEHWLRWLNEYDGPGYYRRSTWDVTAETVYNRVVNPSMVLWLGEAVGVPRVTVARAAKAALGCRQNMAVQSAAVRTVIPWSEIAPRL